MTWYFTNPATGLPYQAFTLDPSGRIIFPDAPSLTAQTGGGQTNATPLGVMFTRVTGAVATAAPFDSVALPPSEAGLVDIVVNATAVPIQVFGSGTDQVNGQAAATGVTQAPNSIELYLCPAVGQWYADLGQGFAGSLATELMQDSIIAHAGGGQGAATALTADINRITVVATTGDSVVLPPSAPGLDIVLINHGANPAQVYGMGTDTIDDIASGTGVTQMQGSVVLYICAGTGRWYSNGIGTGFAGQYPTVSFTDALTAHAGGGQAAALQLTTVMNRVTTVATAADSVRLPASAGGMQITVINAAAANALNVFPATGDQINVLGANNAFSLAAGKVATFYCTVAGQWHSILSA